MFSLLRFTIGFMAAALIAACAQKEDKPVRPSASGVFWLQRPVLP